MRVLHLSDVHVSVPIRDMPWRRMLNKRLLGAGNLAFRRGPHYARAREKLIALGRFAAEQDVDMVICTGDYTALGTEPELAAARQAIEPLLGRRLGFATVPGNHDIYLPDAVRTRSFERHFGTLLTSDLPDARVDGVWPYVRLLDDDAAIIAVNSARPNPQPWRSSGFIPPVQLEALRALCADERLANRFVFVITHYAPRRADASIDTASHRLVNADAFLDACSGLRRGAILHGHIHRRFQLSLPELTIKIFGAGSTTCDGREGLWLFDVHSEQTRATPGHWEDAGYVLENAATIAF